MVKYNRLGYKKEATRHTHVDIGDGLVADEKQVEEARAWKGLFI